MYRPKLAFLLRTALPLLSTTAFVMGCGDKDRSSSSNDDDGTGGTDGSGGRLGMGGEPMVIEPVACDTNADCNDYFYCNGEERCVDGLCRQGTPIDCDDGIDCTIDRCIEDREECRSEAPDEDGDGHADESCEDDRGEPLGDDCDDDDSFAYPGNQEVCDPENRDEDCNPETFGTLDSDQDGFIDALCANEDEDGNIYSGDDCDDKKTSVNPLAQELCDFLDNNCDGQTDEGVSIAMYEDKDHDGRGDDEAGTVQTCLGAVGYAQIAGDCDDEDPEVFTGQFEICDDKDNNCNDVADEVRELAPWYKDLDGDGYGDPESTPVLSCYRIPGRVLSQNDCNDDPQRGGNTVNPNATEICDGLDNDCNGRADFKLAGANNFEDDDDDGAADSECGGPDCNDLDPRTAEGAEEVCDRIDNDCDGEVDEQTVQNIWYIDEDGDGWGVVIGSALASCDPIPERASQFGDCDDTDREVKPGVSEACDGIDNDCDGLVDEGAGSQCGLDNALSTCRFGRCEIFSCLPGYEDDDDNPNNGCEQTANPADYATTTECSYDSACNDGNLCNGIETCVSGFCRLGTPINCGAGPSVVQGNFTIQDGRDIIDLEGIELITGDLTISSQFLTSLIGLETLRVISGNLYIQGNGRLVRLSGSALSNLEVVGGDIVIDANPSLRSVALPSLTSARSLVITNNAELVTIDGLGALSNIDQHLEISYNPILETVAATPSLGRIGGDYAAPPTNPNSPPNPCLRFADAQPYGDPYGGLHVANNPVLHTIEAFASLEQIEGDICLDDNPNVTAISLDSLDNVGKVIDLKYMDSLVTFEAPSLRSVGGYIEVGGGETGDIPLAAFSMPSLIGVGGTLRYEGGGADMEEISFPNLINVDAIQIGFYSDADLLTEVDFSALESAGSININYSTQGSGVPIWEFPALTDVGQLSMYLTGDLTSLRAPVLESAEDISVNVSSETFQTIDFPALTQVSFSVYVSYFSEVNALTGVDFGALTTVGTSFSLYTPTQSLDIGQLSSIGADLGELYLYVSPYDVCSDRDRILTPTGTFQGYYETSCGQQTEPEL